MNTTFKVSFKAFLGSEPETFSVYLEDFHDAGLLANLLHKHKPFRLDYPDGVMNRADVEFYKRVVPEEIRTLYKTFVDEESPVIISTVVEIARLS